MLGSHIWGMVNTKESRYYYQSAAFHKTENEVPVPQYLPKSDAEQTVDLQIRIGFIQKKLSRRRISISAAFVMSKIL